MTSITPIDISITKLPKIATFGSTICPKCGSNDLKLVYVAPSLNTINLSVEALQVTCNTCAYSTQMAPLDTP